MQLRSRQRAFSPNVRRGAVVLEFLMAMPILVIAANYVIQLTFDAAFMTGTPMVAMQAAREGARVYPIGVPFQDPQGEPSDVATDLDDIADRIALLTERQLWLLGVRLDPFSGSEGSPRFHGLRVRILRGGLLAERGDRRVVFRQLPNTPGIDEIEVQIGILLATNGTTTGTSVLGSNWYGAANLTLVQGTLQTSARTWLE